MQGIELQAPPRAGLDLLSTGVYTRLQEDSQQRPSPRLVQPGRPERSYLWLRLVGLGLAVHPPRLRESLPRPPGGAPRRSR